MELREWKKRLQPYEYAMEELKVKIKNVRKQFKDDGEYSPIEFVTGRIKKISSILDKAKRLGISVDEIDDKMEDIAGLRIMCQFVEDIYTVVDILRTRNDMTVVYEKDYIKNYKESGYRSYHVIIRYPVQAKEGEKEILVEIQIRTLSMNFWATIEHSLKYKYNEYIPEDIALRLRRSADAAFLLDQEMSEIREEIQKAQVMFEMKSLTVKEIVESIQAIYRMGRTEEALRFQALFDRINTIDDLDAIVTLKRNLESLLDKYNKKD